MKNVIRLARGTVRVCAEGSGPESILNRCAEQGIAFWDVSPTHELAIEFSVSAKDYDRLMAQNGRNGIGLRVVATRGGKSITRAVRRRLGALITAGLCVVALAVSSLFIWRIDISGSVTLSSAEVLRALADCGVYCGRCWVGISPDRVRSELLTMEPCIAWAAINVRGSVAEVVLHERIDKPEIIDESGAADIVASKDGVIKKLTVLSGQAQVQQGEPVAEGETIISGTVTGISGETSQIRALGEAQASTWYEISACTPLYETVKTETTRKRTGFSLVTGKKRIKIFGDSRNPDTSCDKIKKLRTVSLKDVFVLPVGIIKERTSERGTELRRIDEKAAIGRMKETLMKELLSRTEGETVSTGYTVSKNDEILTVTLHAECLENIGESHDRENDRGREDRARH